MAASKKERQQQPESPLERAEGACKPLEPRSGDHAAIITDIVANTLVSCATRDPFVQLATSERRQVMHVLVALRTQALPVVAGHCVPVSSAGLGDFDGRLHRRYARMPFT